MNPYTNPYSLPAALRRARGLRWLHADPLNLDSLPAVLARRNLA